MPIPTRHSRATSLLFLAALLACAPEGRTQDLRFVSLKPAGAPGEWTAVLTGKAVKSPGNLSFQADGQALSAEPARTEGESLQVRLKGAPVDVSRIEARIKGKPGAAVEVGAQTREEAPFNDWIIYHVMVEMFANGSPGNDGEITGWKHPNYAGGDLQGVLEKAGHIEELGANAVWLSPIFLSRTSHGYDVQNYYRLANAVALPGDPEASLDLFRRLVGDLHGRGIRVILDVPLNHASASYQRKEGDPEQLDPKATGARQEAEKVWESWGADFRYWSFDHKPTRQFLKNAALHWLAKEGVDGLRLDYVRGVPHDFWAELYADVKKAKPGAFLVGEAWIDAGGPEENAKDIATYSGKAGGTAQFDALFDFPMQIAMTSVFAQGVPATGLETWLQATAALYGPGVHPARFLDNHDTARFMAWTDDPRRLTAAVGFLASLSGPIVLFYGTETGLSHGSARPGFTDLGRIPMPWKNLDTAQVARVRAILEARREHPALSRGGRIPLLAERDHLVMAKVAPEETVLVGVNLSGEPREVTVDVSGLLPGGAALAPVLGEAPAAAVEGGRLTWRLPPLSTVLVAAPRDGSLRASFCVRSRL